jgi:hypothetical protein
MRHVTLFNVVIAYVLIAATAILYTSLFNSGSKVRVEVRSSSSLSQRINAACKKGYELGDWTTTNPVRVTCIEATPGADHNYDSYVTAVTR